MTIIAYHLLCDCKSAVNAYSCPVGIIRPTTINQYDYYRCNYCDYDYICDHSIKIEFTYDDKGLPEQNQIVCSRCGTQVEVYTWPLDSESIDNAYVSRYVSIYKRNY